MNIGAVARAMSNFGVFDLRLVNPYRVAVEEARSAVGGARLLETARQYSAVCQAVSDCTLVVGTTSAGPRDLEHPLRRLDYAARLVRGHPGRTALLFGSEKFGLSNEHLSFCHWLVRIPTREEHRSMNLGQAVAVCLYELARNPRPARQAPLKKKAAAQGELERLERLLLEALSESGYLKELTSASMIRKIRRALLRLEFSAADAELWQGMLRQMLWKMRR